MSTVLSVLDVSTGHLRMSTREWLDSVPPITVYPHPDGCGWFIPALKHPADGVLPGDLAAINHFSLCSGCDYMLFDRDADPNAALPWFDDGEVATNV